MKLPFAALPALLLAVGAPAPASGFGVDVAAALSNRTDESTCVPINYRMFRMVQPDGVRRVFLRDDENPDLLHVVGGGPWIGVVRPERNMVNVVTRPGTAAAETEFCYVGGHLRFMGAEGRQHAFDPASYGNGAKPLTGLWPSEEKGAGRAAASIWQNSRRLAFLSSNPNRSALLFAHLALAALGLALFTRRTWLRTVAACLAAASLALLAMTASRGGVLAFVAGAGVLAGFRMRGRLTFRAVAGTVLAACLAAGALLATQGGRRILSDLSCRDASATNRAYIWRAFPSMLRAAPMGWGRGRSGFAYNDWFEEMSRHHSTGDLFNDHLSRLAEFGLPGGAAYLFAWVAILLAAGRAARGGGSPTPLAVWTALAVAGCFNPVQVWGWAWLAPLASLPWIRPSRKCLLAAGGGALAAIALCWGVACAAGDDHGVRATAGGRRICFGGPSPDLWIVDDGFVLDGGYPGFLGKELRARAARIPDQPAVGVVRDPADLPARMKGVLVSGRAAPRYLALSPRPVADRVVFLSPPFGPEGVPAELRESCEVLMACGEFAAARMDLGGGYPDWMAVVAGAELYVPNWPELLLR